MSGPGGLRAALRAGLHSLVRTASRNYIAGPTVADAMRVARLLVPRGYATTLGYWDAAGDAPDDVLQTYLDCLDQLAGLGEGHYTSIKLPGLRHDPGRYRSLEQRSRECGIPLCFDSLDVAGAETMFTFLAGHLDPASGAHGCVLPGRWRRSVADAARATELGLIVRVVKGQSPDPADPGRDPAAGYLEVVRALAGRARLVRVASHDPAVARASLEILQAAGTPGELELLYGLPVGSQVALAREFGVPVRVYVAFGHAFLPYALASLRQRPTAVFGLMREAARGDCLATFPLYRRPVATAPA